MRYFVIADDGQRYGPADLQTLNQWASEKRLVPSTLLEEESTGTRIAASAVAGLSFGVAASEGPPLIGSASQPNEPDAGPAAQTQSRPYANYYRPGPAQGSDGTGEMIASWVCGAAGLLVACCCLGFVPTGLGIYLGARAKAKGHPAAQAAIIWNVVVLVLSLGYMVWQGPKAMQGIQEGMQRGLQQGLRAQ